MAEAATIPALRDGLRGAGYLADEAIATAAFLALRLEKPLLVEGPAGTGKTELAKALARATGARLIRLQCHEGLDEARALYEWNYRKQLLRLQSGGARDWQAAEADIFAAEFLLERPLLAALRAPDKVLLLIDEIDRVELEAEALLLEVLAEFQISIPELGTIAATRRPIVVLTSNDTRELSEALRRRCLFLHVEYPSPEREAEILRLRVPALAPALAEAIAGFVAALRRRDLRKAPSIAESIDWARTLLELGRDELAPEVIAATLNVLLKHQADILAVRGDLPG